MPKKLTLDNTDYFVAAKVLNVEPAAVKAVATVESHGAGFYDDGFPMILFERHKFYKHAPKSKRDQWAEEDPSICNPKATPAGGYGTNAMQRTKFNKAFGWDADAAMMACSWGIFQELGENYADYDFAKVGKFVDRMKSGAMGQLEIFIRSIQARKIDGALAKRDWAAFAANYNGPDYKKFEYDTKMAAAYEKAKKEKFLPPK